MDWLMSAHFVRSGLLVVSTNDQSALRDFYAGIARDLRPELCVSAVL